MTPFAGNHFCGVRCIVKRVVFCRPGSLGHFATLIANCDHGLDKTVELIERLAFGWLNHECAGNWKRHCWGVKTVVDQTLGNVVDADSGLFLNRANIDDALVGNETVVTRVEKWVVTL